MATRRNRRRSSKRRSQRRGSRKGGMKFGKMAASAMALLGMAKGETQRQRDARDQVGPLAPNAYGATFYKDQKDQLVKYAKTNSLLDAPISSYIDEMPTFGDKDRQKVIRHEIAKAYGDLSVEQAVTPHPNPGFLGVADSDAVGKHYDKLRQRKAKLDDERRKEAAADERRKEEDAERIRRMNEDATKANEAFYNTIIKGGVTTAAIIAAGYFVIKKLRKANHATNQFLKKEQTELQNDMAAAQEIKKGLQNALQAEEEQAEHQRVTAEKLEKDLATARQSADYAARMEETARQIKEAKELESQSRINRTNHMLELKKIEDDIRRAEVKAAVLEKYFGKNNELSKMIADIEGKIEAYAEIQNLSEADAAKLVQIKQSLGHLIERNIKLSSSLTPI